MQTSEKEFCKGLTVFSRYFQVLEPQEPWLSAHGIMHMAKQSATLYLVPYAVRLLSRSLRHFSILFLMIFS
jgi:hypothetical protein